MLALIATLGSLFFSEVRMYVPCTLCWYQRILMYPLVLLLGIASYRQDREVVRYALPLSSLGVIVSAYHLMEQKIPGFGATVLCRSGVPCSGEYINWFGFLTIPGLALIAFLGISVLLLATARRSRLS